MAATMKVFQHETRLRTAGGLTVTDITEDVQRAVRESEVTDGIACIYSPHTTCCVRVNEMETGFLEDFCELLKRLVPHDSYYAHDDWDRRTENICPEDMDQGNGHSHCMAMLLGTAGESVPVREGELQLGTWQRVLFIELDLSALGDGAQGSVTTGSSLSTGQVFFSTGQLAEFIFMGRQKSINPTAVTNVAQAAANKIDAAGLGG
jgi:secondary thiamine-phosphate synthase enzyme